MKFCSFLSKMSLLMFVALGGAGGVCFANAQDLPWKQGGRQAGQSTYGRQYTEPGRPYDPARDGGGMGSRPAYGNGGRYDGGYDALRNENRPRPYARQGERPYGQRPSYREGPQGPYDGRSYNPPPRRYGDQGTTYPQRNDRPRYQAPYQAPPRYEPPAPGGPGRAYAPPSGNRRQPYSSGHAYRSERDRAAAQYDNGTYSDDEILDAGHRFFGKMTKGLAKVIAHVFKKSGRPSAYILGEEGGGAFVAGLRYGEGTIYTKWGDRRRVYWQGPSVGYDFGAEGAKTMILVYHLRNTNDIYQRFGGVDGSAYLVGGVGVTFQKRDNIVLAPIRTGVGLRLGANIGYLKYTRRPTWNPF